MKVLLNSTELGTRIMSGHLSTMLWLVAWIAMAVVPPGTAYATFVCSDSAVSPYVPTRQAGFDHARYAPMMNGLVREFEAYIAAFDTADDDDGDGNADFRAIPEWVAYQIKAVQPDDSGTYREPPVSIDRPSNWYDEPRFSFLWDKRDGLTQRRLDDSYDGFGLVWNRGHLAMSDHAQRISAEAACNTHHFWNGVPQAASMNQGPWQHLENYTAAAANKFGTVWVVAGPIVDRGKPVLTIGRPGTVPVVVPNALFKIIVRETGTGHTEALGFIFEQAPRIERGRVVPGLTWERCSARKPVYDHTPNLRPIREIEARTGLRFFGTLSDQAHEGIV